MNVLLRVLADEGLASAVRRTRLRLSEAAHHCRSRLHAVGRAIPAAPLLNVCGLPLSPRYGGVPVQLAARLAIEAQWRTVAVYTPGWLQVGAAGWPVPSLSEAVARTAATTVHVEGSHGLDLTELLALPQRLLFSLHDFALESAPAQCQALLARCVTRIYPSAYAARRYGVPGHVIAPASAATPVPAGSPPVRTAIAFVGAAQRHKGAALLPELMDGLGPEARWHVFGGGDSERLLRPLRRRRNVSVHGWFDSAQLPRLLQRHRIGVAVLPSLCAESFSLSLSECWLAGVPAISFDHAALGERIGTVQGSDWLAPLDDGATGLIRVLRNWLSGALSSPQLTPPQSATAAAAAVRRIYAEYRVETV